MPESVQPAAQEPASARECSHSSSTHTLALERSLEEAEHKANALLPCWGGVEGGTMYVWCFARASLAAWVLALQNDAGL